MVSRVQPPKVQGDNWRRDRVFLLSSARGDAGHQRTPVPVPHDSESRMTAERWQEIRDPIQRWQSLYLALEDLHELRVQHGPRDFASREAELGDKLTGIEREINR